MINDFCAFSILKIGGKKNEDSKYDQKITIAVLSAAMMLAPIVNIKAASTDVVDTSKNRIYNDPQI